MPIFMNVTGADGPIQGGGILPAHENWVLIEQFTFGRSGFDDMVEVVGGKQPRADFGDSVTIERVVDLASAELMNWVRTGDLRTVEIDHCTQDGTSLYKLKLTGAALLDYKVRDQSDGALPETLTVTWKGFEITTAELGPNGASLGAGPQSPFVYERPAPEVEEATSSIVGEQAAEEDDAQFDAAALVALASGIADAVTLDSPEDTALGDSALLHSLAGNDERAPDEQTNRRLEIDDVNGKSFELLGFSGNEGVSRPFEFTLELTSTTTDIAAADVVGQKVGFRIVDTDDIDSADASPDRNFHGRIRRFWAGEVRSNGSRHYRAEVVPWTWFLTKRSNCRVFQNKTVVEIVEQVFGDANFSDFEKNRVMETYPKLEYCVQYRETDFDFVARLLEENGILFFFKHERAKHTLVLADDKTVHVDCAAKDVIHSTGDHAAKRVYAWERRFELVAKKASLRDYNYLTPADNLHVEQSGSISLPDNGSLELFDYPGAYLKKTDGDRIAKARIQAEEARHDIGVGRGNWDALEVGKTFTFKEHEASDEVGKKYVVARIDHRAGQKNDGRAPCVDYHSTFSCVPDSVMLRPVLTRSRPRILGPQTAVVVGPSGEEIETDKYGRVKVQFHWDRLGKKDENSSCWLRVAQPIAGKGWGALVLPRVGQEVLVEFLDGDPDRPLVVGTLYNETSLPKDLPAKKNQTVFRTRSTKEGGDENFNELSFDDTKDAEKIYFHAEKDMERIVEHDDVLTIGKEDEGSRTVTIEKDSTLTINKGNRTETITEGNDTLTIEKGDRTISVKTGKETVTIKADRTVTIESGKDVLEVKASDQSVKIGGKGEIEATSGYTIKVTGGKMTIDASPGIELKSGSNTITLGPSGIEVKGLNVKIEGQVQSEVKAAMVKVEGSGMLQAKGGITMIG